jgi:hypothetical protein
MWDLFLHRAPLPAGDLFARTGPLHPCTLLKLASKSFLPLFLMFAMEYAGCNALSPEIVLYSKTLVELAKLE